MGESKINANAVKNLFQLSLDMLCIAGLDGYLKHINPAFEKHLGWTADELLKRPCISFVHPDDVQSSLAEMKILLKGEPSFSFSNRICCADGSYKLIHWSGYPELETGLVYAVGKEITDLETADNKYTMVMQSSPTPMLMIDSNGRILMANDAVLHLFQYSRKELINQPIEMLIPINLQSKHHALREAFNINPQPREMGLGRDLTAVRKDGAELLAEVGLGPIETAEGLHTLVTLVDLTARKKNEQKIINMAKELKHANRKLAKLAATDSLTGLKNRRCITEDLVMLLELAKRNQRPISLLMVDVDHFKEINDNYGHQSGDEILKLSAHVFLETARRSDQVGRYGGEEFIVILPDTDEYDAMIFADRLRLAFVSYQWPLRNITISIGVSTIPYHRDADITHPDPAQFLIGEADEALYVSKELGRNRVTHWQDVTKKKIFKGGI